MIHSTGIVHSDDVIYILKHWFPMITRDHPDARHLERILDLWVAFLLTGDPNNDSDSSTIKDVNWSPYEKGNENYLDIGRDFVMRSGLFLERYRVWESIFP